MSIYNKLLSRYFTNNLKCDNASNLMSLQEHRWIIHFYIIFVN